MSPKLALLLCIAFIIIIQLLDKKYKEETSWTLWIPTLWLLISASRPIVLWLNPGLSSSMGEDASEGSPYDRIFLIFILISGSYILLKRKLNWPFLIRENFMVFLFFFYCGLSIIWSDSPSASFNAWVKIIILLTMALVIITDHDPVEALRTVIKRTYFVLIPLSITLIKYFPEYGRTYSRWTGIPFYGGVNTYKNGLGILCMVAGIFLVWDFIRMLRDEKRSSKIPLLISMVLIGMVVWLLSMSDSATAEAGFIIGITILIAFEIPFLKSKLKNLNVFAVATLFLALLAFASFNALESAVESLGRDMTLTGRTLIWERVLDVDINPIVGTGYGSFWTGWRAISLLDVNNVPLTQAHNGYIETYLNLGIMGLFLLCLVVLRVYTNTQYYLSENYQYGKLLLTYFLIILLANVTEATIGIRSTFWFLFVIMALRYNHNSSDIQPTA